MKRKCIKRGAHAITFLAIWWTLFSAFGIFDWINAQRYIGGPDAFVALTIWSIHLFLIGLAIFAWVKEKPTKVLWFSIDEEVLDRIPEDLSAIDVDEERAKLKRRISVDALTIYIFVVFILDLETSWGLGIFLLLTGIMVFSITASIAKYRLLQRRIKEINK